MLINDSTMERALQTIISSGGTPLFVGGCVRDYLLGNKPKDIDIEVYNMNIDTIVSILSQFGKTDVVGKSFGVIKFRTDSGEYDVSVPRTESKSGVGHKDFSVTTCEDLSFEEAFSRRDFTINAIGMKMSGEFVDPFDGKTDIIGRTLFHTSSKFSEDPLRVLRGMQFCGRFNLTAKHSTLGECLRILLQYNTLPVERIWGEWEKWAKSHYPHQGIYFLRDSGWIHHYPEITAMVGALHDEHHHQEGDVFQHTLLVLEQVGKMELNNEDRIILTFTALLHDCGKAATQKKENGKITNYGHEEVGAEMAHTFLTKIGCPDHIRKSVCELVKNHMFRGDSDRSIRRLSTRCNIALLSKLIECDYLGRCPIGNTNYPKMLAEKANSLRVLNSQPDPIVTGKKLLELGYQPGPEMGKIIKRCYELQLDGCINVHNWEKSL